MNSKEKRAARTALWHGQHCPHCGIGLWWPESGAARNSSREATLDHIVPRWRGGSNAIKNLRIICLLCNQARAVVGDCVGALACVRAVIGRKPMREVAHLWMRRWGRPGQGRPRSRRSEKNRQRRQQAVQEPPHDRHCAAIRAMPDA